MNSRIVWTQWIPLHENLLSEIDWINSFDFSSKLEICPRHSVSSWPNDLSQFDTISPRLHVNVQWISEKKSSPFRRHPINAIGANAVFFLILSSLLSLHRLLIHKFNKCSYIVHIRVGYLWCRGSTIFQFILLALNTEKTNITVDYGKDGIRMSTVKMRTPWIRSDWVE